MMMTMSMMMIMICVLPRYHVRVCFSLQTIAYRRKRMLDDNSHLLAGGLDTETRVHIAHHFKGMQRQDAIVLDHQKDPYEMYLDRLMTAVNTAAMRKALPAPGTAKLSDALMQSQLSWDK